jgi:antirestriction protein ArdC
MNTEKITQTLLARMQQGHIPWKKTWHADYRNGMTGHEYSGTNVLMLSLFDWESPYFYTFNQIKQLGGSVLSGAKGVPIVFHRMLERTVEKDGESKVEHYPMFTTWTVFNHSQTTLPPKDAEVAPLKSVTEILQGYKNHPEIKDDVACVYYPIKDTLGMPKAKYFDSPESYGACLFHELTHSTGHKSRLDRNLEDRSGYSFEELVAEIGACFLCHKAEIETATEQNTVAYLQGWLKRLGDNPDWIIKASSLAQKSTNFILGKEVPMEQAA